MTTTSDRGISAPPSTAWRVVDVPELAKDGIAPHGFQRTFVGAAEEDSPWVPFGDGAAIKHLAFDTRHSIFSNILWIKANGVVGTDKHGAPSSWCASRGTPAPSSTTAWSPTAASSSSRPARTTASPSTRPATSSPGGCRGAPARHHRNG